VEQAPVAMCVYRGPAFVIEVVNEKYLALGNKTIEQLLNKPLFEAFPEARNQGFEELLNKVYRTGEPYTGSEVLVELVRNGEAVKVYLNFVYEPLQEADGTISGIAVVANEITEQVTTRKKIEESENRFQNLVREASVGIILLTGPKMKVDIVNEAYGRLIGRTPEELLGKELFSIIPDAEEMFLPILENVRQTGEPLYLYDTPYAVKKDVKTIEGFLNLVYQPYHDIKGNRTGVLALCQDITQQVLAQQKTVESESRFRTLADQSPIIVFMLEPDTANVSVSYFNKTWLQYTGQTFEESLGRAWDGLIHTDDLARILEVIPPALQNKTAYELPAIRLKRFDGVYRWHYFKGNPRFDTAGEFLGFAGVGYDIHDRVLAEQALRESEGNLERLVVERTKELQRSNEDLQQFAHVASHDLKEPARKIKTFLGMLEADEASSLSAKGGLYLKKVQSASERLLTMINGVLEYSTLSGSEEVREPVDLESTIQSIEADLEVIIHQKGAVIHYAGLPVITGSSLLLYQLFYNLINNSLKFSRKEAAPVIRITSAPFETDGQQWVQILLSDNGIGFDEEAAHRIFDTFTRLNSKDHYDGTGLGLALCKKIVQRHGGSIEASGEKGKGAVFTIRLPVGEKE
jgi:hypothetical protein